MNSKTFKLVMDITLGLLIGAGAGTASFFAGATLPVAAIGGGITAIAFFGAARLARFIKAKHAAKAEPVTPADQPKADDVIIDAEVHNNGPEPAPAC